MNAQTGYWDKADELLAAWVAAGNVPVPEILRQLKVDGRFSQFQAYRKFTFLSFDSES